MSKAHHSEPLQWHWLYIPLIAFFSPLGPQSSPDLLYTKLIY